MTFITTYFWNFQFFFSLMSFNFIAYTKYGNLFMMRVPSPQSPCARTHTHTCDLIQCVVILVSFIHVFWRRFKKKNIERRRVYARQKKYYVFKVKVKVDEIRLKRVPLWRHRTHAQLDTHYRNFQIDRQFFHFYQTSIFIFKKLLSHRHCLPTDYNESKFVQKKVANFSEWMHLSVWELYFPVNLNQFWLLFSPIHP